ncbi:MAG TPA: (Fe-S)-binding protein [Actinopolymorphaceae bacterium]
MPDRALGVTVAVVTIVVTLLALALVARAARRMVGVLGVGQPLVGRRDLPRQRWLGMLRETLGHTRLLRKKIVGAAHFSVFVGFGFLFFTLVTAYGQVISGHPGFALPMIGHWAVFEFLTELIAWATLVGIGILTGFRLSGRPSRPTRSARRGRRGRSSRFYGSRMWQGYYVEATVLAVALCILALRALEYALSSAQGSMPGPGHFALTGWLGALVDGTATTTLANAILVVAGIKILVSIAWFAVIAGNLTMGVAWHRFTAFPNIWFRRFADGRAALGALPPVYSAGAEVDFTDPGDDDLFGIGKLEDFSWKGLLDFTTCTECGRCQDVCPAWATGKPLSPKLLVLGLREHAYAKAPSLLTTDPEGRATLSAELMAEADRPLVGGADVNGVIDPDVLWSCTNCGACVQECPVDIEHVDHIDNMRRHQVLVEADFPDEFNGLFRGLENNGNPWNLPASGRLDWARGLSFDVPVVGGPAAPDVADLGAVEYLFWVGCAGAFDDRAKKTTRAVAELLHTAGVGFAVLGQAESCSGDPARRAGNEFVYRMLAEANVEVLREAGATKVIASCAHCFNTLKNEYAQLGLELEVLHHTQVLNRLVRDGALRPVAAPADTARSDGGPRTITYHDPCFLGRHNQVYSPPRDLLAALPGLQLAEMPRHGEKSFCCGAGGAQMWKEESLGTRVNAERTREALATGATTIATGCPFCKTMLGDGVAAAGADAAGVDVADVAQLLWDRVQPADAAGG